MNNFNIIKKFYLAGGTAVALYLGHRYSDDFDLFSPYEFHHEEIIHSLKQIGNLDITGTARGTLHCLVNEIKLSFLYYDYPLKEPLNEALGISIAGLTDIGLMKITAIASRGSKKDFIDLYFIARKHRSLEDLFTLLPNKFEGVNYSMYHLIKSLSFFEDAENEPDPIMIEYFSWEEVKSYFRKKEKVLFEIFFLNEPK
ncbi:MAG: hypothetical protein D5R97_04030 [Candidatus Syntrophonatronum acetioxidans]|uniref:Nucleotidyl transferase AbiEii/AbiGii toxin family protein n=1 Tax=Candidatus Syntrophonatronum acetioxidans TaxID=1795816 RepID=A0A424YFY4_9FIRM|nr:MAG: hypothetical protein D5R97_04030 [Candidatus Syntrophonatronum acetioxidans]